MPDNVAAGNRSRPAANCWIPVIESLLQAKSVCGEMERYVTSDTFTLRSRFHNFKCYIGEGEDEYCWQRAGQK